MHHEPELVDEVAWKQRTEESAAAEDRDVLSRLPLEPGDLFGDIALDQGRVVPLEGSPAPSPHLSRRKPTLPVTP
jgi:hypothetical protein